MVSFFHAEKFATASTPFAYRATCVKKKRTCCVFVLYGFKA